MAKLKTPHNSKKNNYKPKPLSDEYWNFISQATHSVSEDFIIRFAEKYHAWALNPNWRDGDGNEPLTIEQFYISEGMLAGTFYYLTEKHPILLDTHKQVKAILSARRSIGALKRRYEAGTMNSSQYKYDSEYLSERERIELKAKHKAEEEKKLGPQNFNIIKGCPDCVCGKCRALFMESK